MKEINNLNSIYTCGKLTIKCFVWPEKDESGKVIKYHGTTHVATVEPINQEDIIPTLNREIIKYLQRCKFKDCERTFSWEFKTF